MDFNVRDLVAAQVAGDLLSDIAKKRAEFLRDSTAANALLAGLRTSASDAADRAFAAKEVAITKAAEAAASNISIEELKAEIEVLLANNVPDHQWVGTSLQLRSPNGNWGVLVNLKGADGKSAYQHALDQGFEGGLAAWLASLVGPKGDRPSHEWDGTELTFENADGTPGETVDLKGDTGNNGWAPVIAIVNDSARRVQKVVDWTGGTGTKPAINKFIGASGLVDAIGDGVDVRGAPGASGEGSGDMQASVYDPNGVADDAFDMANMVEAANAKVMTGAERTKLAGIEAAADVTDQVNVAAAGAFMKASDTSDNITEGSTKKFTTAARNAKVDYFSITANFDVDAAATKLGYLTVSAPTDLDALRVRVAELGAAIVLQTGTWDASAGTFPGSGAAKVGQTWIVGVAGTVNGVAFNVGDRVTAIANNASTTTFASNWFIDDYTDRVSSVAGRTGNVTLTADDVPDGSTNKAYTGTEKTKLAGIASGATANDTDANLKNRANHTGTQLAATISDFSTAADARISAAIGSTVMAYSANLAAWSAVSPSSYLTTAAGASTYLALTGGTLTSFLTLHDDPSSAMHAATKQYVDGLAANLGKRQRVRAATTANITISTALNNGDSLDGVTLATGDLVLVKDQSTAAQNGVYVVGVSPARATEFDTYDEHPGSLIAVQEGTTNGDKVFLCTSNVGGTLDSTAIAFSGLNTGGSYGRRHKAIMAGDFIPRQTNGMAFGTLELATNKNNLEYLAADPTTQEFADYLWFPPPSWDGGTISGKARWTHPSTTTNFGVVWQMAAVAVGDNESLDAAFGTAQTMTDTGGTTSREYISPECSAVTVAGSPSSAKAVWIRVARVPANASDNMAVDAYLIGLDLFYNENSATD